MPEEFHLDGNGHGDVAETVETEEETQDQLQAARIKLDSLTRNDGVLVSLTKQDLSLLKTVIHSPEVSQMDDFIKISLICDFLDDEEADRELNAFHEAVRYGMDTKFNIGHALSRAATNSKGRHNNSRIAMVLDSLHHQKFTSNQPRGHNANATTNPRSPLA